MKNTQTKKRKSSEKCDGDEEDSGEETTSSSGSNTMARSSSSVSSQPKTAKIVGEDRTCDVVGPSVESAPPSKLSRAENDSISKQQNEELPKPKSSVDDKVDERVAREPNEVESKGSEVVADEKQLCDGEQTAESKLGSTQEAVSGENENENKETTSKQTTDAAAVAALERKSSKSVRFSDVRIFEFERCQGFSSIPGNFAPLNETITLGMQYQHDAEESFASLDEYLKYKRRVDLDKVEAFVRQQELERQKLEVDTTPSSDVEYDLGGDDPQEAFEKSRLERAKYLVANRHLYENDLTLDLDIDPDISCPVLTNEERMEKLARLVANANVCDALTSSSSTMTTTTTTTTTTTVWPVSLDLFDQTECLEVNEILKSREICGCECSAKNQTCTTDDCSCFANGINCQIDRLAPFNYPCRCNSKKCKNTFGLRKFNLRLVEKHKKEVLSRALRDLDESGGVVDSSGGGCGGGGDTNTENELSMGAKSTSQGTPQKKPRRKKRLSSYSPHKRKKQK